VSCLTAVWFLFVFLFHLVTQHYGLVLQAQKMIGFSRGHFIFKYFERTCCVEEDTRVIFQNYVLYMNNSSRVMCTLVNN